MRRKFPAKNVWMCLLLFIIAIFDKCHVIHCLNENARAFQCHTQYVCVCVCAKNVPVVNQQHVNEHFRIALWFWIVVIHASKNGENINKKRVYIHCANLHIVKNDQIKWESFKCYKSWWNRRLNVHRAGNFKCKPKNNHIQSGKFTIFFLFLKIIFRFFLCRWLVKIGSIHIHKHRIRSHVCISNV